MNEIYKAFIHQKLVDTKNTEKQTEINFINVQLVYKFLSTADELNTA